MIPLRRWLSKQPHPSLIEAEFGDGTSRRVRLGVARSKFRDAEEALVGAISCEALDEKGDTIRVWESGEEAKGKTVDPKVAEATMLVALAKVIGDVSDQAVKRYAEIVSLSFEQNAKLLGLISGRLAAIEKLYHSSLIAQAEALAEEQAMRDEQQDQDQNLPLVAQVLTQALQGNSTGKEKD